VTAGTTPSQTVGPYFTLGLIGRASNELVPDGIEVTGRVLDGAGDPVPDAVVELWQADEEGNYRSDFGWARAGCDADGRYSFRTVKPGRVPDEAGGLQAPHLVLLVFARGLLKPVLTRMYFPDEDEANAEDLVLSGVEDPAPLVAAPAPGRLEFDLRLQGEGAVVAFAV
jgi:protocatechuate 3,4-dioxygenase alpha subunit